MICSKYIRENMIYKSPFATNKVNEEIINNLKTKGVIVFGTGNFGSLVNTALMSYGIKINHFIDNNLNHWGKDFEGVKILSAKEVADKYAQEYILIASLNFKYIRRQLKDLNIKNVFDVDFLFENFDLSKSKTKWSIERCKVQLDLYNYSISSFWDKDFLKVNSIDLVLTEKCSLKCKDCSNLMQYYEKPIDNDLDVILKSFDNFIQSVDYCYEVRMIGGEPLIYKNIDKVLEKVLSYRNVGNIVIYTNGTIVPKGDKIKVFKNDKVYFRISDYGAASRNVSKLEIALKENSIHYITERVTTWQDCAVIKKFDRTESLTKEIFGNCCVNETLTLLHGKLYLCPYSAHIENLKVFNPKEIESIDLHNISSNSELKTEIRKLYFDKEYLQACTFCNGRDHNVASIEAAIQTKEPLAYQKF